MQTLPVNARPPVEQLRHERDVEQLSFRFNVARPDERSQPDPLSRRDDQTGAAKLTIPLGVFVGPVALIDLEVVVQFLRRVVEGAGCGNVGRIYCKLWEFESTSLEGIYNSS